MKTYTIQELLELLAKWEPLNLHLHEAQVKCYAAVFLNQTAEQEPKMKTTPFTLGQRVIVKGIAKIPMANSEEYAQMREIVHHHWGRYPDRDEIESKNWPEVFRAICMGYI